MNIKFHEYTVGGDQHSLITGIDENNLKVSELRNRFSKKGLQQSKNNIFNKFLKKYVQHNTITNIPPFMIAIQTTAIYNGKLKTSLLIKKEQTISIYQSVNLKIGKLKLAVITVMNDSTKQYINYVIKYNFIYFIKKFFIIQYLINKLLKESTFQKTLPIFAKDIISIRLKKLGLR